MIIQIYEIQTPAEAEHMVELGVDTIGSVVVSESEWKDPGIKETVQQVQSAAAKSSLIPLFNSLEPVLKTLDYYQPDIVHFCEALIGHTDLESSCRRLIELQQEIKTRFPQIRIMRSIPIIETGKDNTVPTFDIRDLFEPWSDFLLTDTLLVEDARSRNDTQPVAGFVGITGQTCDWKIATQLVETSHIPVILAGGLSPENVFDGILQVRPAGVDSCTLTNARDGNGNPIRFKKDTRKVKQMIDAVRKAEKTLEDPGSEV
jgi:phosphoribosylanthranilate isomerase